MPTFSRVRVLWLHTQCTQDILEVLCQMPGLEQLYLKWGSVVDLAPLAQRPQLSHLHIGSSPAVASLAPLQQLPLLVDLGLDNVAVNAGIEALAGLSSLRALRLGGASNSLKPLRVASLEPLAALTRLERLVLHTLRVDDERLAPLAALQQLRYLGLPNAFDWQECAKLAAQLPHTVCDSFVPHSEVQTWTACKRCKAKRLVLPTGRKLPMWCLDCDAQRVARHVAEFEVLSAG